MVYAVVYDVHCTHSSIFRHLRAINFIDSNHILLYSIKFTYENLTFTGIAANYIGKDIYALSMLPLISDYIQPFFFLRCNLSHSKYLFRIVADLMLSQVYLHVHCNRTMAIKKIGKTIKGAFYW